MDTVLQQLVLPGIFGLGAAVAWWVRSRYEAVREVQRSIREDQRQTYVDLLMPMVDLFTGIKNPNVQREAQKKILSKEYRRTSTMLLLLGGDAVVQAHNDLYQFMYQQEKRGTTDAFGMMRLWGAFLLEVRKSLGHKKTKLEPRDMLAATIKDIDEVFAGPMSEVGN